MQVVAREKGVDLALDLPGPYPVRGDVDRLRQLFFNLLDNAIKYTPPGGRVTVQDESSNGHTRVTIADTGFPGRPIHGMVPSRPNPNGAPGRMRTRQNFISAPNAEMTSRV